MGVGGSMASVGHELDGVTEWQHAWNYASFGRVSLQSYLPGFGRGLKS